MSVSLKKGQKVDLTKDNSGLKSVVVGLGWDEAQPEAKGVFGGLFGGSRDKLQDIDCDAIAFMLDGNGKLGDRRDIVFFNNLKHPSGSVIHQGDNLTGEGDGDDEQILIDLAKVPQNYERIVIMVSIYKAEERRQHFGKIKNAFIRLVDNSNGKELCIYNLSSENFDGMNSMVFGELYRRGGEWKFSAVGEPLKAWRISDLAARYGYIMR